MLKVAKIQQQDKQTKNIVRYFHYTKAYIR